MKAWFIASKDTLMRFQDRNGILLMLVAPMVLAAVIGAAFGGLDGSSDSPIADIPIVIVDEDNSPYSKQLTAILQSEELSGLLEPSLMDDLSAARELVGQGSARAAVHIPSGYGASLEPGLLAPETSTIAIYTDPGSTFSPLIVESVVTQVANGLNSLAVGGRVAVEQLLERQALSEAQLAQLPAVLGAVATGDLTSDRQAGEIAVNARIVDRPNRSNTNPLAYFAPSMAVLFLMFTLFSAARSILEEERAGTLPRLVSSPTAFSSILLGKIGGVFLTGVMQLAVLVLASRLLFQLEWGHSLAGLALMIVAIVAAASSLGAFIVAFSQDEQQAAVVGSAIALIFAILGGNFFVAQAYPDWLQPLSKLTINRWALDGLTDLTLRGLGLADILEEAGVLLALTLAFFSLALWRIPRRLVR